MYLTGTMIDGLRLLFDGADIWDASSVRHIVGLIRALVILEDWLDGHATSWLLVSDREYAVSVRDWSIDER